MESGAEPRIREEFKRDLTGDRETTREVKRAAKTLWSEMDEATIPDTFRNMPKLISPRLHRWLDVAVTAYFVGLGAFFAARGRKGPAIAAFLNGGMVAGVSMFTDYEGTGEKPISFKLHGTLDAVQATTAALAPVLHGFADESASAFFYAQAGNELAVISSTDWDAGMPAEPRERKAA